MKNYEHISKENITLHVYIYLTVYLQLLQNVCSRIALEKGFYRQIASRDGSPVTARELADGSGADVLLVGKEVPSRTLS